MKIKAVRLLIAIFKTKTSSLIPPYYLFLKTNTFLMLFRHFQKAPSACRVFKLLLIFFDTIVLFNKKIRLEGNFSFFFIFLGFPAWTG